jgi:uncharacterized protein YbjT (DUF2867 family)
MPIHTVFLSGGTGYMGRILSARLIAKGHRVHALVRPGSERKAVTGSEIDFGNALDPATFAIAVRGCDTLVHLTGVAHPAPWKEREFRAVDLASLKASAQAAAAGGVSHFVYVSVAHPAPVMRSYITVRRECEAILERLRKDTGMKTTVLRPWYVLGPGHRWPVVLLPMYMLLEKIPSTRESALRLGLVTLDQMAAALAWSVENAPAEVRVLDVPGIREITQRSAPARTTSQTSSASMLS